MGILMARLALCIAAVAASGCTIVLSSTPCDTAGTPTPDDTAEDTGPDTGDPTVPRTAREVVVGGHHTCAVDLDGIVECWGLDSVPDLLAAPDSLTDPRELSAGYLFTCALPATTPAVPTCWGDNDSGQHDAPEPIAGLLAAGGAHACGKTESGGGICWGRDTEGQTTPPLGVTGASDLFLLASGWLFSCAQTAESGAPVCWGYDDQGQVSTSPGQPLTHIALGQSFGIGILQLDRSLTCWGRDDVCDLVAAESGTGWQSVAAGVDFACGLSEAGDVKCWGPNENGVIDGIPAGTATAISAGPGSRHACAILDDGEGTVACWGLDASGQATP
jgi:alpha-tubulin suppressor-like RCC1 family protein